MEKLVDNKRVEVAVGLVFNEQGQILIAQRPAHTSHAGFWEFPGGKIEAGETAEQGLVRELQEEIGVTPLTYTALKEVPYDYETKKVLLKVFRIESFEGIPYSAEGQIIRWIEIAELKNYPFPAANKIIMSQLFNES